MKAKYRLFRRGKIFYADTLKAKRLIAAKNEAVNNAQLTLAVDKAYLAVIVQPHFALREHHDQATNFKVNAANNPPASGGKW